MREGRIFTYTHSIGGRVGAMIELRCETDFAAKTEEFEMLGRELLLQVASMAPRGLNELLDQKYVRDNKTRIRDLIGGVEEKLKEHVFVMRFTRWEL